MAGPIISGPQANVVVTLDPVGLYNRYDTYVAIDPNDSAHLIGICRRFFGPGINYQDVFEFQSSFDGGQTWTLLALPLGDYYSISDPWIGIAPNGNIYVIALQTASTYDGGTTIGSQSAAESGYLRGSNVCCYTSVDSGQSWSSVVIPGSDSGYPDNTFGAIDPTFSTVYAIWNSSDDVAAGLNGTLAFASSPDGNTWTAPQNPSGSPVPGGNSIYDLTQGGFNFVNISVAPDDGSIHIIGSDGNNTFSYARSQDRGRTFSIGVIATQQAGGNDIYQATTPLFLGPQNPPAIFAAGDGLVFAAWSVDTGHTAAITGPQMRICISSCSNGGDQWALTTAANAPTTVPFLPLGNFPQTPEDQYFLPRLAGMPYSTVGCAFLHCKLGSPAPGPLTVAQLSTMLAVSLPTVNNPHCFQPNSTTAVVVSSLTTSPISSNPVHRFGSQDGYFIGDFIGLAGNVLGFVAYWSDTREAVPGQATAQIIVSFLPVQNSSGNGTIHRVPFAPGSVTFLPSYAAYLLSQGMSIIQAIEAILSGTPPPVLTGRGPVPESYEAYLQATNTILHGALAIMLSNSIAGSASSKQIAENGLRLMEQGLRQLKSLSRDT